MRKSILAQPVTFIIIIIILYIIIIAIYYYTVGSRQFHHQVSLVPV